MINQMENEERQARQTLDGLESLVQLMRQQSLFGHKDSLNLTHKSVKSTIAIINNFMEKNSDKFKECSYDLIGEDLDYIERAADNIMGISEEKKVAV